VVVHALAVGCADRQKITMPLRLKLAYRTKTEHDLSFRLEITTEGGANYVSRKEVHLA
jgi:hypothetical protein